jgi:hypothetical protein
MSFAGFFVQLESVESQISKFDAPNCSLAECVGTKGESSLAARSAISREPRRECHGTAALQGGALRKPWSPIPVTTIRHHVAIDRAVRTTARRLDRRRRRQPRPASRSSCRRSLPRGATVLLLAHNSFSGTFPFASPRSKDTSSVGIDRRSYCLERRGCKKLLENKPTLVGQPK